MNQSGWAIIKIFVMIITITSPANLVSVSPIGFFKKPLTIKIIPDKSSLNATNDARAGDKPKYSTRPAGGKGN